MGVEKSVADPRKNELRPLLFSKLTGPVRPVPISCPQIMIYVQMIKRVALVLISIAITYIAAISIFFTIYHKLPRTGDLTVGNMIGVFREIHLFAREMQTIPHSLDEIEEWSTNRGKKWLFKDEWGNVFSYSVKENSVYLTSPGRNGAIDQHDDIVARFIFFDSKSESFVADELDWHYGTEVLVNPYGLILPQSKE